MTALHPLESFAAPTKSIFGTVETRAENMAAFRKWTELLQRYKWEEARRDLKQPCRLNHKLRCRQDDLKELLGQLAPRPLSEKIKAINSFMNEAPYVTDIVNWGVSDYWATTNEFLQKDGDCEDYAIAKYFSLKALGVPSEHMRIVIVQDSNLNIPHAVLAVYDNALGQGVPLILDNQLPSPVKSSSILHYKPLYSINEHAWWFHRNPVN